jgi:Tol biopolymer transport system component
MENQAMIRHRCAGRQLLLAVLGLVILTSCGRPLPFGIVFTTGNRGNGEIYRITSDGRNVERLTHTPGEDEQYVEVSRDGNSIIFDRGGSRRDRELFRLDVSPGTISQLTHASGYDYAGAWSPDGSQIAFISDRDGGYYRLFLMNADGSDQQHISLVTDEGRDVTGVSWSPDGRSLVYGTRDHVHSSSSAIVPALFVVDLLTLDVRRLTDESVHGACTYPDWSWDGEWIAMVCTKGIPAGDYGEIYIIRPDGSGWQRVTTRLAGSESDSPKYPTWTWVKDPHWSPDGRQIVYTAVMDGECDMYIIGAGGENNHLLSKYCTVRPSIYRLP